MKRYSLVGLLTVLVAVTVWAAIIEVPEAPARMTAVVAGGGSAPVSGWSCDCSGDVSFCWSFENTTITSGTPAGCTDGADTAATGSSAAALDNDGVPAPKAGSYTLSIPTSNDFYTIDVTSEDAIATEAGRVDFWVWAVTSGTLVYYTVAYIDASNYIAIGIDSDAEAILRYTSGGTNYAVSTVATLTGGEWWHIVASWSVAGVGGKTLRIGVNQTDTAPTFVEDTDELVDMGSTGLAIKLGDATNSGGGGGYSYDNLRIYKVW